MSEITLEERIEAYLKPSVDFPLDRGDLCALIDELLIAYDKRGTAIAELQNEVGE